AAAGGCEVSLLRRRSRRADNTQQFRAWNMEDHLELAGVEPNAAAFRAHIDLHVGERPLMELGAIARTFDRRLRSLPLRTFRVERRAAFTQPLGVAPREVFILILTWLAWLPHAAPQW